MTQPVVIQSATRGTRWKIWARSFHWYPIRLYGWSGLAITASQSQAFLLWFTHVNSASREFTILILIFKNHAIWILTPIDIFISDQKHIKLRTLYFRKWQKFIDILYSAQIINVSSTNFLLHWNLSLGVESWLFDKVLSVKSGREQGYFQVEDLEWNIKSRSKT